MGLDLNTAGRTAAAARVAGSWEVDCAGGASVALVVVIKQVCQLV